MAGPDGEPVGPGSPEAVNVLRGSAERIRAEAALLSGAGRRTALLQPGRATEAAGQGLEKHVQSLIRGSRRCGSSFFYIR